jgi:cytochrome c556
MSPRSRRIPDGVDGGVCVGHESALLLDIRHFIALRVAATHRRGLSLADILFNHGIVPMRVALMILLGLVIGVIGTVNVMNTLAARNPMPKAVMETMGYHVGELKHAIKAKQCDAVKIQHHLQRLQSTATDIVPVFGIDEKTFTDKAGELQTHLQQALQAAPANCEALVAAIKPVGETCKSCHQQ